MIALLLSLLFFAYCVVPSLIFRTIFSFFLPLRSFERTKTQEIRYIALVCLLPFVAAMFLVWYVPGTKAWPFPLPDTPSLRAGDYRAVFDASLSETIFEKDRDAFWAAAQRSTRRQGRVLFWYYAVMIMQAALVGLWSRSFPVRPLWQKIAHRVLVPNISEWHVLLTPWAYPGATTIVVSVLTDGDHLYRGEVLTHTLDAEGKLTGVYLTKAERFDRAGYLRETEAADAARAPKPGPAAFWKPIAGTRLFITAESIQTLNVTPPAPLAPIEQDLPGATLQLETEAAPGAR